MRSFKHWTPRYLAARLRLALHARANPDEPWLTAQAVQLLETWLRPSDVGLEWGSGRSTVWLAKRTARVLSVEHHAGWFERVRALLRDARVEDKVSYRLCPDGQNGRGETEYVKAAELVADSSLDFALVDGVSRDFCARVVLPKLRQGGLLIVDNVNWFLPGPRPVAPNSRTAADGPLSPTWREVSVELRTWRNIWTTNGVTDTAFWVKPCATPESDERAGGRPVS